MGRRRLISLVVMVGVSACSSGSDSATAVVDDSVQATTDQSASDQTAADEPESSQNAEKVADTAVEPAAAASFNLNEAECEELGNAGVILSTLTGLILLDSENLDTYSFNVPEMQEHIELWRTYQDIDGGLFGTVRQDLDNLENDLVAGSEGRFDDLKIESPAITFDGVHQTLCG